MSETININPEFEQTRYREVEQKFIPLFPCMLQEFRKESYPIEQFYLSGHDEEFTLRLRQSPNGFEATLKDKGQLTGDGLDRLEITTVIDQQTYAFYNAGQPPRIRKLRAEPSKHITIDWFENGRVQLESEHPIALSVFIDRFNIGDGLVEVTDDRTADNTWMANFKYRQENKGRPAYESENSLSIDKIVDDILKSYQARRFTVVQIGGRSGSGKSTLIGQIKERLSQNDISNLSVSTDDYHRGKSWLENYKGDTWTEWDAPIVYDTALCAKDIARLTNGLTINSRSFDFETEEPVTNGRIKPAPIILVEGIYALSNDISKLSRLSYEMPTPFATCVGRRLLRDLRERPQFAQPEKSLRYILEQAEPAYRAQK